MRPIGATLAPLIYLTAVADTVAVHVDTYGPDPDNPGDTILLSSEEVEEPPVPPDVAFNRAVAAQVAATVGANTAFLALPDNTDVDLNGQVRVLTAQVRTLTTSQSALIYLLLQRL